MELIKAIISLVWIIIEEILKGVGLPILILIHFLLAVIFGWTYVIISSIIIFLIVSKYASDHIVSE